MRIERSAAIAALLAGAVLVVAGGAMAADAGAPAPPASSASARANPHGAVPPGHPQAEAGDDDEDPGASPASPHGRAPKGHGGGGDAMFQPPEDGAVDDPTLPPGTLEIQIVDPNEKPIPGAVVTLGILENSVAKGESRKRVTLTANDRGVARAEHLEIGSTVAYRPMVISEGATFSAMPFRLPERTGMKARLHVYPVVDDVSSPSALVVSQSIVYAEVKDDRVQVQQAFKVYNLGKTAWVPKDLVIPLPDNFTAFSSQQGMTDVGVDAVPKQGVRVRGTFPPGQHMVEFRWQLPYSGEAEVRFDLGMPPHVAAARVIAPASKDMHLEVPGFPPPQSTNDGMGQRALVTEKQIGRNETPVKTVSVIIRGLPTEGPGRLIATVLSAGGLVLGLVFGTKKPERRDRKSDRARLLEELAALEQAKLAGEIGPKTYAAARREILDALARTFADDAAADAGAEPRVDRPARRSRVARS